MHVLIGDPGRQFLQRDVLTQVASYELPPMLGEQNWGMENGVVWSMENNNRSST